MSAYLPPQPASRRASAVETHLSSRKSSFSEKLSRKASFLNGALSDVKEARGDQLERQIKPRQLTMIAIGGVIGSGLFIGTGSALANGGPASLIMAYLCMGVVVYSVMIVLGEMAALYPVGGGFVYFATRFVDPAVGVSLGWTYFYEIAITVPTEAVAGAIVIDYWDNPLPPVAWITIFLVLSIAVNFIGVKFFSESEFALSTLKVLAAVIMIITGLVIDLGGAPSRDRIGFRFWKNPGAFNQFEGIPGATGRFLGFWSCFVQAGFSYAGTEIVALTASEALNPGKAIPAATKATFWRILFFFIGGVIVIGMTVPYTEPRLAAGGSNAAASPFVIAINTAGIKVLPHIINAVILISAFSASNAFIYASSRTLYGLALDGQAPKIFGRVTKKGGLPWVSITASSIFGLFAYLSVGSGSATVFNWLVTVSSIGGIIAWVVMLFTYIRFYAGLKYHKIDRSTFPYRAPYQPYLSWFGLIFLCLVILFCGFKNFLHSHVVNGKVVLSQSSWNTTDFITSYVCVPIFIIVWAIWKVMKKSKFVRVQDMNFDDRAIVNQKLDDEEKILHDQRNILQKFQHWWDH